MRYFRKTRANKVEGTRPGGSVFDTWGFMEISALLGIAHEQAHTDRPESQREGTVRS